MPATQAPQLASLVETAPEEDGWISEVKFDGYRLIAIVSAGKARLMTRNGLDWTNRMPRVAAGIEALGLG